MSNPDLSVMIGNVKLKNPVMSASGTFGEESCEVCDVAKIGAIVPKTVTMYARDGNKMPRVVETVGGMLNSIGIQSQGLKHFVETIIPVYSQFNVPVIPSISGFKIDEFQRMVEMLNKEEVIKMIELNISCPNIEEDGKAFAMSSESSYNIVKAVKSITDKVIIPKLTPNVQDITEIAIAVEEAGADAVSLTNTFIGMEIDTHTRKPKLGNIIGGLSGPCIKPISLRMVYQTAQKVKIPLIGIGGISSVDDAIEYFLAGATAIQVGTANFINPNVMVEIVSGIEAYMSRYSINNMDELIGKLIVE